MSHPRPSLRSACPRWQWLPTPRPGHAPVLLLILLTGWAGAAPAGTAYVCQAADGSRSIQDTPCDGAVQAGTFEFETSGRTAAPAATRSGPDAKPAQRPRRSRRWTTRALTRCKSLQDGKLSIHDEQRAGLTAAQGQRLARSLRKINADIDSHCRNAIPQQYWLLGRRSETPPKLR